MDLYQAKNNKSGNPIGLNETALLLLSEGCHEEAISTLEMALSLVRTQIKKFPMFFERACSENSQNSSIDAVPVCEGDALTETLHDHGNFRFFQHAFTISSPQSKSMGMIDRVRLIPILFYNAGVAHHHEGIRTGNSDQFHAALDYYITASKIVESSWRLFGCDDFTAFLLGLWNNIGHIHSFFFNTWEAKACLSWIRHILQSLSFPSMAQCRLFLPLVNSLVASDQHLQSIAPCA